MKPTKLSLSLAILGALLLLTSPAWSHSGHGDEEHHKKGILLVTFGTSSPEAREELDNIDDIVNKTYPDTPVRWAYTSKMIRKKLAKEGEHLNSPAEALSEMQDEGFTHVAVQSLHVIEGYEYNDLLSVVRGFRSMNGDMEKISVGRPLLAGPDSLEQVKQAMLENIPEKRDRDEAVLYMGHGTHHPANASYQAMAYMLQRADRLVFVGTVEGAPKLETILPELKQKDVDSVYLMPFMSVAGDHARNDMAGSGDDSWKSVLQKEGFEVKTVMKGMAVYDNIVQTWLSHLDQSMSKMKSE